MPYHHGMVAIYHDINHEARSMEMLQCIEMQCDRCSYVSYAAPKYPCKAGWVKTKEGALRYWHFVRGTIRYIRKARPDLILLHDNMCAPVLKWLVKSHYQGRVVYDSSELYLRDENLKRLKQRAIVPPAMWKSAIASWILRKKLELAESNIALEAEYIKYADVVIAANEERAQYMRDHYALTDMPLIYDNIHRIDEQVDLLSCDQKFQKYFSTNTFHILYAGGIAAERHTFDLVRAVCQVSDHIPVKLFIAGRADADEKKRIDDHVAEKNAENIFYLGYLTRMELKYLLQRSQASVSAFDKKNMNHLFCASGKIYESLFEGVPIITSTNPPLQRLCKVHGIGVSSDDFAVAIEEIYAHYEAYLANVKRFIATLHYETRVPTLAAEIRKRLHDKLNEVE